ncbi:MAG: Hint domain-containing protein [Pseudomonadota bacterium]
MSGYVEHADTLERLKSKPVIWNLPGFGPMTRISTSFGEVPAQALRERDIIRTGQGNLKPISWIDRMQLDAGFLENVPDAHAVLIRAGALGKGLPKADVVVSPEQLVGTGRHLHDVSFVKAKELLGRPGVLRKPEEIMTYTLFHCGESVVARVEGLWARITP